MRFAEAKAPPERHSSVPYSLFNEPLGFRPFVDARLSRSGRDVKRFLKDFFRFWRERASIPSWQGQTIKG